MIFNLKLTIYFLEVVLKFRNMFIYKQAVWPVISRARVCFSEHVGTVFFPV